MSIKRAIERVEEKIHTPPIDHRAITGLILALKILKEEAEPPCERCKELGRLKLHDCSI